MSDASEPRPMSESLTKLQRHVERVSGGPVIPMAGPSIDAEVAAKMAERWRWVVPREFWEARLEDLAPEAAEAVEAWTMTRPLPNLVVTGPTGAGKTHLAVAAIRPWFERGTRVAYAPMADLMDAMRPGGEGRASFDRAVHVDLLVLDDVAATRDTEWTDEVTYRLVDGRWRENRPIIATTNLPLTDLAARVGPRVYERLCLSGAVLVQLGGESRRRRP